MKIANPQHVHSKSARATDLFFRDPENGIFVEPAVIDPAVGEELILILRDDKPMIEQIAKIESLRLVIGAGTHPTLLGPVSFLLFYVSDANDPADTPIVSDIKFFNPHDKAELAFWRRLADADHWHLFLMVGNKRHDIIGYDNKRDKFKLHQKLNEIIAHAPETPAGDPSKARELLLQEYTIQDLLNMPEGKSTKFLVFKKTDK